MASSGWCRHPLRQDLQYMVLVRKNELACRQSLGGEDLWEAKDDTSERLMSRPDGQTRGAVVAPNRETSVDVGPVRTRSEAKVEQHTDKIAAIGVARDAVTEIRPTFGHHASINTPARDSIDSTWGRQNPTATRAGMVDRPDAQRTERTERADDDRADLTQRDPVAPEPHSSAPAFGHSTAPAAPATEAERLPQPSPGRRPISEGIRPPADKSPSPRPSRENALRSQSGTQTSIGSSGRTTTLEQSDRPSGHVSVETEARPTRSGTTEQFAVAGEPGGEPGPSTARRAGAQPDETSKPPRESEPGIIQPMPNADEREAPSRSFGASPKGSSTAPAAPSGLEPTFDRNTIAAKRSGQVPVIPCCCRTCLDFRPAEGGARGMCVNRLAFEQPTMVSADDIACASSIGNWWVPNNDWWEQKIDTSHHGRPTPNFDSLIKQLMERYPKAKREAR